MVVAPMLLLESSRLLPLPRRHPHAHQVLLLVQSLAESLMVLALGTAISAARGTQQAASLAGLGSLAAVDLLLSGEARGLVG